VAEKLQLLGIGLDERVTVGQDAVRPVDGVGVVVKLTVPVKPLRLVTVIISWADWPTVTLMVMEAGLRLKSAEAVTVNVSQALVDGLLLASPL